jgi:PleD family two-component response regulator
MSTSRVIELATKALQDAKDLGRNRVVSQEWEHS